MAGPSLLEREESNQAPDKEGLSRRQFLKGASATIAAGVLAILPRALGAAAESNSLEDQAIRLELQGMLDWNVTQGKTLGTSQDKDGNTLYTIGYIAKKQMPDSDKPNTQLTFDKLTYGEAVAVDRIFETLNDLRAKAVAQKATAGAVIGAVAGSVGAKAAHRSGAQIAEVALASAAVGLAGGLIGSVITLSLPEESYRRLKEWLDKLPEEFRKLFPATGDALARSADEDGTSTPGVKATRTPTSKPGITLTPATTSTATAESSATPSSTASATRRPSVTLTPTASETPVPIEDPKAPGKVYSAQQLKEIYGVDVSKSQVTVSSVSGYKTLTAGEVVKPGYKGEVSMASQPTKITDGRAVEFTGLILQPPVFDDQNQVYMDIAVPLTGVKDNGQYFTVRIVFDTNGAPYAKLVTVISRSPYQLSNRSSVRTLPQSLKPQVKAGDLCYFNTWSLYAGGEEPTSKEDYVARATNIVESAYPDFVNKRESRIPEMIELIEEYGFETERFLRRVANINSNNFKDVPSVIAPENAIDPLTFFVT